MKVLGVCTSDIEGGAARAAYRLHRAFLSSGIDSKMLVQKKSSDDYRVQGPQTKISKGLGLVRPSVDQLPLRKYPNKTRTLFSSAWVPSGSVVEAINQSDADVVHLHWVAGGMLRIGDIAKIRKPIVWTLHDMWAFTGGCHYDEGCGKYAVQCGACPVLGSEKGNDLSRRTFLRKKRSFLPLVAAGSSRLHIVTPSRWLGDCVRDSLLLRGVSLSIIPNTLDLQFFRPIEKKLAREVLGLPLDRKLIAFGAVGGTADPRKGWAYLSPCLKSFVAEHESVNCVIFGQSEPADADGFGLDAHWMGHLHDDASLKLLYSAADVMVVSSLEDNLPNTVVEAQACGCPVVAFDVGGLPDIVRHKSNGYLAEFKSSTDLAEGIKWVLSGNESELRGRSRGSAEKIFDPRVVTKSYSEVFESVVSLSKV